MSECCPTCGQRIYEGLRPLTRLRLVQGLPMRVVARMAGVSPATISRFEHGRRIKSTHVTGLARAYGVTTDELLELAEGRENGHE